MVTSLPWASARNMGMRPTQDAPHKCLLAGLTWGTTHSCLLTPHSRNHSAPRSASTRQPARLPKLCPADSGPDRRLDLSLLTPTTVVRRHITVVKPPSRQYFVPEDLATQYCAGPRGPVSGGRGSALTSEPGPPEYFRTQKSQPSFQGLSRPPCWTRPRLEDPQDQKICFWWGVGQEFRSRAGCAQTACRVLYDYTDPRAGGPWAKGPCHPLALGTLNIRSGSALLIVHLSQRSPTPTPGSRVRAEGGTRLHRCFHGDRRLRTQKNVLIPSFPDLPPWFSASSRPAFPHPAAGPSGTQAVLVWGCGKPTSRNPNKPELRPRGWGSSPQRPPWKGTSLAEVRVSSTARRLCRQREPGAESRLLTRLCCQGHAHGSHTTGHAGHGAGSSEATSSAGLTSSPSSPARPHHLPGPDPPSRAHRPNGHGWPEVGPGRPQAGSLWVLASPRGGER